MFVILFDGGDVMLNKVKKILAVLCVVAILMTVIGLYFGRLNFALASVYITAKKLPLVIIDAGHGGFDGGCVGVDGSYEKDINLQISLKLNDLMQQLGFKTLLVRDNDCSVETDGTTIRERKKSDIKNRYSYMTNNSDCVYLSVHQNQYSASSVKGAQMFYTPDNDKSKQLAQHIQNNVASYVQADNKRKIKPCTKDVYIIHYAPKEATAVLIECGFLSNYSDLSNLKDAQYQKKLCFSICIGVLDWLKDAT